MYYDSPVYVGCVSEARSTQLETMTLTITQLMQTVHVHDWMMNES